MGKKPYIKPEIREESSILTVRAWVSNATAWAAETDTSVAVQESETTAWVQTEAARPNVANVNYWRQSIIDVLAGLLS